MTDRQRVEPDPFVSSALQLLPVPEHHDGFWAELREALDAEPAPGGTGTARRGDVAAVASAPPVRSTATDGPKVEEPDPVVKVVELVPQPLGLVPPALRSRSNLVLSAVAVAAAVMVVIAGTSLVRERSGGGGDTTELAGDTLVSSTSTSISTLAASGEEGLPTNAVLAWVGALSTGDLDAAWTAMGPASQAHWGSKSAFEAERTGLAEGYGAWSAATPDDVYITSLTASGDGEVVVVTLVGTVDQEGSRQHRADAFPVRVVDGVARLEPFAFAGELEIVVPEPVPDGSSRPIVQSDDELVVVVPRGVDAPMIRLDDGQTLVCGEAEGTELTELETAPGQRCSYRPDGGIEAGVRVFTVAFLSPDGTGISAESVLFEAA
ncbi:MAG: hypothetical protein ACRDZU_16275 [Acidimicrobiales bacterium]